MAVGIHDERLWWWGCHVVLERSVLCSVGVCGQAAPGQECSAAQLVQAILFGVRRFQLDVCWPELVRAWSSEFRTAS